MDSNRYRIITAEALQSIALDSIIGGLDEQRVSNDGMLYMVELAEDYTDDEPYLTHAEAIAIIATPEWDSFYNEDVPI